jgi:hypothetical protein
MKRLAILLSSLVILMAISFSGIPPVSGAMQAPPTNTKRPTLPPTNTKRATATLVTPPTNTLIPTKTQTPTRTPTSTKTLTLTPSPTPTTVGPVNYPENINPLTGQEYPSEEAKNRKNIIVKVSNYTWIVRPQGGLSDADLVWEYEVEGGVTRFAAIYRSKGSDHVGSVRSGRLPDLELVPMYQALLAYSGSNDNIKTMILKGSCIDPSTGSRIVCSGDPNQIEATNWKYQAITPQFGDNCPPFCRFPRPGVPFEHTLYANTNQIWELAEKRNVNTGLPARGFAFADEPDPGGKTASDIGLKWFGDQDARWQYNPADHKYYRWNTGLPHMDANTGLQLTADNVIIIQAYHKERPDIYESESGSKTIEVQLWGTEKAWVFRDGHWYQGIWQRRNRERGALVLMQQDGVTPIHLKPGQSWVEVVRCCDMYGVDVSDQLVDTLATGTLAAGTATAKGPRIPADSATKTAAVAVKTNAASAATAGVKISEPAPADSGPTATQITVGLNIGQ